MSKKAFLAALSILVLISGFFTTTAQEKFTIDKVVAVVGNSIILYSDIQETADQFAMERRQYGYTSDRDPKIEALESLLEQKLLYNQALIDSIELQSKIYIAERAEDRVGEMVASVGSVAALEEHFHTPIFEIKRIVTTRLEEQEYAMQMRRELQSKVKITPGEVERFYKKQNQDSLPIIPIQYVYAQITKFPESTREAKLRTREQLLGLRERIIDGTRFDVLARMYSEDGSAPMGGELEPMTLEEFESPFAKALEKLKPGQVSEVVETVYGFHLIQLIEKIGPRYRARHILVRPQFTGEELIATDKFLDSLAVVIRADSIDFKRAALFHSDDKYSKYNGGLVVSNLELMEAHPNYFSASDATTRQYKEQLPVDDFRALENLQPGEISNAFQTQDGKGNKISKIVKLLEIIPSHTANLKDDYLELEKMALHEKISEEYVKWLDKKIDGMFIRIDPEFRVYEEFENKSWLK